MSTETPTLADVLQLILDDHSAAHFQALPGRVESYDAATQTANILPMTKHVVRTGEDERIVNELSVLSSVPVVWPRAGGYFIVMPLAAGDGGLIICCDSDLGAWRDSGEVSDPGDERRHSLTGCVFVPGLDTVARALSEAATGHMVLGQQGGPSIHIDGSAVQLGDAGGQFVALASLVWTAITTLKSATLAVAVVVDGIAPGTSSTFTTSTSGVPGNLAATLVKAT